MRDDRDVTPIERAREREAIIVLWCSKNACYDAAENAVDSLSGLSTRTDANGRRKGLLVLVFSFFFLLRVPLSFHSLLSPCRRFLFATLPSFLSLFLPSTTALVFVAACSAIGNDDDDDNIATRLLASF